MRHKIAALIAAIAVALTIGFTAAPASAATVTPDTGSCHFFTISMAAGTNDGISPEYTVPSTSTCNDIQVNHMSCTCGLNRAFLVIFYPAHGEPYVGNTHEVPYNSSTYTVLATDVLNGTRFAIQQETAGAEGWSVHVED